jgi:hypothetical protein
MGEAVDFTAHPYVEKSWVGSDGRLVIHELDEGEWVLVANGKELFRAPTLEDCAREARRESGWSW